MFDEKMTLNNGVEIPTLGFGTWLIDNDVVGQAVNEALSAGYRHIDTAQAYRNEEGIGRAVADIPREDVFITTKVSADYKTYDSASASIDASVKRLGTHADLIIIHAPTPWAEFGGENRYPEENLEVWAALEDALSAGKTRAIGLSNFMIDDVKNIMSNCSVLPMVNQVLIHVGNTPVDLIEFCQSHDIVVEAYSPLGHGEILAHPLIVEMAEKYGVTPAQLAIRYTIDLGCVALPKSTNPERIRSNGEVDFEISDEDLAILLSLEGLDDYGEHSRWPVFKK